MEGNGLVFRTRLFSEDRQVFRRDVNCLIIFSVRDRGLHILYNLCFLFSSWGWGLGWISGRMNDFDDRKFADTRAIRAWDAHGALLYTINTLFMNTGWKFGNGELWPIIPATKIIIVIEELGRGPLGSCWWFMWYFWWCWVSFGASVWLCVCSKVMKWLDWY